MSKLRGNYKHRAGGTALTLYPDTISMMKSTQV